MLLEEEEGHFLVGLASNLVVSEGHMDSFSTNLKCYLLVAYSLFLSLYTTAWNLEGPQYFHFSRSVLAACIVYP